MDFLELAKERYSVRKFDTRKVEKEKLDLILEAGRLAQLQLIINHNVSLSFKVMQQLIH